MTHFVVPMANCKAEWFKYQKDIFDPVQTAKLLCPNMDILREHWVLRYGISYANRISVTT